MIKPPLTRNLAVYLSVKETDKDLHNIRHMLSFGVKSLARNPMCYIY